MWELVWDLIISIDWLQILEYTVYVIAGTIVYLAVVVPVAMAFGKFAGETVKPPIPKSLSQN